MFIVGTTYHSENDNSFGLNYLSKDHMLYWWLKQIFVCPINAMTIRVLNKFAIHFSFYSWWVSSSLILLLPDSFPSTNKTEFEDFFRSRIYNFGRQLVPRFDNADRKCKLAACQMGQLMTKFEAMTTKIWICWRLEELVNGAIHPPMKYVIHQDQVRAQSEMDQ